MLRHVTANNSRRFAMSRRSVFALAAGICFTFTTAAAQMTPPVQRSGGGSVRVRVNRTDGQPFELQAHVILAPEGNPAAELSQMANNGIADFSHLASGAYTVTVHVPGYNDATADVNVSSFGLVEASVTMELAYDPETSLGEMGFVLAPKAKKELDDGIAAMRARKYEDAQKHLEAAYTLAPGNPDVNDILGKFFLLTKDLPKAQQYIDRAKSLDPSNISALVDSGQLRIEQRDFAGAEPPLEKAVALAPQNESAHWLLSVAYLDLRDYEKSRVEADSALKLSKTPVSNAQYLLGASLAGLGRNEEAIAALQAFVHALPNDPYAPSAQTLLVKLQSQAEPNKPQGLTPVPSGPAGAPLPK